MKTFIHKIKNNSLIKNDGKNFLHFFLAFTLIFIALTLIILQVMTSSVYKSVDENLNKIAQNPNFTQPGLIGVPNVSDGRVHVVTNNGNMGGQFGPTNSVVLYDAKGQLISQVNPSSTNNSNMNAFPNSPMDHDRIVEQLEKQATLNKEDVNQIKTLTVQDESANWHYRYITIALKTPESTNVLIGTKQIAYIQIFSNVDQLQEGLSRSQMIVIVTMIAFWVVSLVVSLYLAEWSMRPIRQSLEKQKAFVENASHELRTPLAILQNRLEYLFQKPTSTIIDESENISESLSEVRNMRLLTSNLLDLAKRDNTIEIKAEETDQKYFEILFKNYQMLTENSQKTFTNTINIAPKLMLDQSLVKQLITILFDNAMKYTGEDGKIDITIHQSNQYLNITVSDNGEGISDEDKEKIFDRFYRVDKARTRQKGGLGLGLSLAQQIVYAYNGQINVQDNEPKGSKFLVRLKLK